MGKESGDEDVEVEECEEKGWLNVSAGKGKRLTGLFPLESLPPYRWMLVTGCSA